MKEYVRNAQGTEPIIIDVEAEEIVNCNTRKEQSEPETPPGWFRNLKEDFISEQVDVRPLNRSHSRRPKSLRSIELEPKKKGSSGKLIFGIISLVMVGFFVYEFSFSSKAIALPSHVNEPVDLNRHVSLDSLELKESLNTFLKDFYGSQTAGNYEFANFFSNKTELYYSKQNPSTQQIKDAYNKRFRKMNNLKQYLVLPSIEFYRNGSELILTYWVNLSYLQKLYNKQESAEVKNEMIIDENGKITSLKQVELRNFKSADIVDFDSKMKAN